MQDIITYPAVGRDGMRPLIVTALVIVVLLAGCNGAGQSGPSTTEAPVQSPTATPTAAPTSTATSTVASTETATPPTTEAWAPPAPPNTPIENASETNRITRVRFFGAQNGSNYTDFDVAAYANTSTATFGGDVNDEASIEAYYFVWIEGEPVAREDVVSFENESLTTIPVPDAALAQFAPGELEVRVALLEADDDGDRRYGEWNGTVAYRPD